MSRRQNQQASRLKLQISREISSHSAAIQAILAALNNYLQDPQNYDEGLVIDREINIDDDFGVNFFEEEYSQSINPNNDFSIAELNRILETIGSQAMQNRADVINNMVSYAQSFTGSNCEDLRQILIDASTNAIDNYMQQALAREAARRSAFERRPQNLPEYVASASAATALPRSPYRANSVARRRLAQRRQQTPQSPHQASRTIAASAVGTGGNYDSRSASPAASNYSRTGSYAPENQEDFETDFAHRISAQVQNAMNRNQPAAGNDDSMPASIQSSPARNSRAENPRRQRAAGSSVIGARSPARPMVRSGQVEQNIVAASAAPRISFSPPRYDFAMSNRFAQNVAAASAAPRTTPRALDFSSGAAPSGIPIIDKTQDPRQLARHRKRMVAAETRLKAARNLFGNDTSSQDGDNKSFNSPLPNAPDLNQSHNSARESLLTEAIHDASALMRATSASPTRPNQTTTSSAIGTRSPAREEAVRSNRVMQNAASVRRRASLAASHEQVQRQLRQFTLGGQHSDINDQLARFGIDPQNTQEQSATIQETHRDFQSRVNAFNAMASSPEMPRQTRQNSAAFSRRTTQQAAITNFQGGVNAFNAMAPSPEIRPSQVPHSPHRATRRTDGTSASQLNSTEDYAHEL